jgi:hypothetical protein
MTSVHDFVTNLTLVIPTTMALVALILFIQRSWMKDKRVISNMFIFQNSVLMGLIVFAVVYLGKPVMIPSDNIIVAPADW